MARMHGLVTASALALAATIAPASAQDALHVAWYGGNWGDAFKSCVADPFTKATGVTVVPEVGTSTVTLAKLQQQKDAPTLDVAWMDGGVSELAEADGVLEPLTEAGVPNLANTLPQAIYKNDNGIYAVGTGYYSLGLTYNTKEIKEPPASWNDLWKPEYADAVTIPSPANSSGVPFLFFLHKILNAPAGDFAPVFARIKELKAALFFDSSGAASNAFQSGEVVIGAHFNVGAFDLMAKGLPIGFTVPKEGVWATDARLHLVKNAPHKEMAQKFIDTALTPEASKCLAEKLFLGPSVKGVTVSAETARKLPWGEKGSVDNLYLLNWTEVNAKRAELVDTWNREIAHK
ncbi:ABC transporter substrate-binding protein [Ancylobacter mangrovi]|uniref:ABC transporter substrate-binding protein n=1 Tax=Ancylobacter mangrovi TaxID=2972472 RepID=A0A9X2PAF8_9HYPH|nr:ABC transporter substrate-binding protein [Ancylobacter mangrovi]MCS0493759.1 ABC transporter substrate-binding protein [Ancylobacter mangrovi]MCS0501544.1 ABC transporter substrate-binding protein [Ancylobacter mangrovi]